MAGRGAIVRGAVLAAALVTAVAACVQADVPESLPGPTSTTTTTAAPATEPECGDPAASLRPTGPATTAVPAGSTMAAIQARGQLVVGVDTATLQLSSIDPITSEFEGFDVDIAREVAFALFGDRDPDRIAFVGIPSSDRVQALVDGDVDIVVDVFTPTCGRREQIDFSTNYFDSAQRVLVRDDDPAQTTAELADHEICGTAGSTTLARVAAIDGVTAVPAAERADCLVMLQEGEVDGMSTNDTILVGFLAQDPNLRFLDGSLYVEPTAIGVPLGQEDMVRYVNAVLDQLRTSGRWTELYDQWLGALLDGGAQPPAPVYVD